MDVGPAHQQGMSIPTPAADAAREQSRQDNGQFGAQPLAEVDVDLSPATDANRRAAARESRFWARSALGSKVSTEMDPLALEPGDEILFAGVPYTVAERPAPGDEGSVAVNVTHRNRPGHSVAYVAGATALVQRLAPEPTPAPMTLEAAGEELELADQAVIEAKQRSEYAALMYAAIKVTERYPNARHLVFAEAAEDGWEVYCSHATDADGNSLVDFEDEFAADWTRDLQVAVMDLPRSSVSTVPCKPYPTELNDLEDPYVVDIHDIFRGDKP